MLALSGFHALRDAIASVADYAWSPALSAPATPERILAAVDAIRARATGTHRGTVAIGDPSPRPQHD